METTPLQEEFDFFKKNQESLVQEYEGKFIVIVGEEVVGAYDTEMEAYNEAQKKHPLGTFLIQHCVPGTDAYTQTFHTRVAL